MSKTTKKRKILLSSVALLLVGAMTVTYFSGAGGSKEERSFEYIEKLKDTYSADSTLRILEIAPSKADGLFGYYVGGSEAIYDWQETADMYLNSTSRSNYVNGLITNLKNYGIISANTNTPLTSAEMAYTESYPWQRADGHTYNSYILDATEKVDDVPGKMIETNDNTGEYEADFTYKPATESYVNYFIYNNWRATLGDQITEDDKRFESSKILSYSINDKNITVFGSTKENWTGRPLNKMVTGYYDLTEAYADKGYYAIDVEAGQTYSLCFDLAAKNGKGQFTIVPLDEHGKVVKYSPNYSKKNYYSSEYLKGGTDNNPINYEFHFTVGDPKVKKVQIRFDISGAETVATFSNIYVYKFLGNLFNVETWKANSSGIKSVDSNNNVIRIDGTSSAAVNTTNSQTSLLPEKGYMAVSRNSCYTFTYHVENKKGGGKSIATIHALDALGNPGELLYNGSTVSSIESKQLDSDTYSLVFYTGENTDILYLSLGAEAKHSAYFSNVSITAEEDYVKQGDATHVQRYDHFEQGEIDAVFGDNIFNYTDWYNSGSNAVRRTDKDGSVSASTDGFITLRTEEYNDQSINASNSTTYDPKARLYYMAVQPGEIYELSYDLKSTGKTNAYIFFSNENRQHVSLKSWSFEASENSATITPCAFTVPTGCYFIQLRLGNSESNETSVFSNIQIRENSLPKAYYYNVKFTPVPISCFSDENYIGTDVYEVSGYKPVGNLGEITINPATQYYVHDAGGYKLVTNMNNVLSGTVLYVPDGLMSYVGNVGEGVEYNEDHQYYTAAINYEGFAAIDDFDSLNIGTRLYVKVGNIYQFEGTYYEGYHFDAGKVYYKKCSPVSETEDINHPYYVISDDFDDDLKAGEKPIFIQLLNYYKYTGEGSTYRYSPETVEGQDPLHIYTDVVFYEGGFTNNEWFKKYVLDCNAEEMDAVSVRVITVIPDELNRMSADELSTFLQNFELFVLSEGGVNGTVAYSKDISDNVYSKLYAYLTNAGYKIPCVIDVDAKSKGSAANIKKLASTLSDQGAGVKEYIYTYKSVDVNGAASYGIANQNFRNALRSIDWSNSESPYYEVYNEMDYENQIRLLKGIYKPVDDHNPNPTTDYTIQYKSTAMIESLANCIRYILNRRGALSKNYKATIRILEIEPYSNNSYLWYEGCGWNQNYYAKTSKGNNIKTLTTSKTRVQRIDVSQWFTNDGKPGTVEYVKPDGSFGHTSFEIDTMTPGEVSGHIEELVEIYDLIYVGCEIDGFENTRVVTTKTSEDYGSVIPDYRDNVMDGMFYTNTGDKITTGSNQLLGRSALGGLVKGDYAVIGLGSAEYWFVDNSDCTVRSSGNDINNIKLEELKYFVQCGLPVIVDDGLCLNDYVGELGISVSGKVYYLRKNYDYSSEEGLEAAFENENSHIGNPGIVDEDTYNEMMYVVRPKAYAKSAGYGNSTSYSVYLRYITSGNAEYNTITADTRNEMIRLYNEGVANTQDYNEQLSGLITLETTKNNLRTQLDAKATERENKAKEMNDYFFANLQQPSSEITELDNLKEQKENHLSNIARFQGEMANLTPGSAEYNAYQAQIDAENAAIASDESRLNELQGKYDANVATLEAKTPHYNTLQEEYDVIEAAYVQLSAQSKEADSQYQAAQDTIAGYTIDKNLADDMLNKANKAIDALILSGDNSYHFLLKANLIGDVPEGAYCEWTWYNDNGDIGKTTINPTTYLWGLFKDPNKTGLNIVSVDTDLDGADDFFYLDAKINNNSYACANVNYWCTAEVHFKAGSVRYNGFDPTKQPEKITSNKIKFTSDSRTYNIHSIGYKQFTGSSKTINSYQVEVWTVINGVTMTPFDCNDDIILMMKAADAHLYGLGFKSFGWHITARAGDNYSEYDWLNGNNSSWHTVRTNLFSHINSTYDISPTYKRMFGIFNSNDWEATAWRMNINGGNCSVTGDGGSTTYAGKNKWDNSMKVDGYKMYLYDANGNQVDSGYTITGKYPNTSANIANGLAGQPVTGKMTQLVADTAVNEDRIDNCSNMYCFVKFALEGNDPYDTITDKKSFANVFTLNQLMRAADDGRNHRSHLRAAVNVSEPQITMVPGSEPVTYPSSVSGAISFKFTIKDATEVNSAAARYKAQFYIDINGDGQFSDSEQTECAISGDKDNGKLLVSSLTNGEHVYTLTKTLGSTDYGIIPWQLKIINASYEFLYDTYSDNAYVQPIEPVEIKAIQVLPSDWRPNYVPHRYFKDKLANHVYKAIEPDYIGSVFVGDNFDPKVNTSLKNLGYASIYGNGDYFVQRTIEYKCVDYLIPQTGGSGTQHVAGCQFECSDEDTSLTSDSWGNKLCPHCGHELTPQKVHFIIGKDFDLSIVFTNIDTMNHSIDNDAVNVLEDKDMLIMGFGDSYCKQQMLYNQGVIANLGIDQGETLGFSENAAKAIEQYIIDGKPVLFCHDSTTFNTNFVNYGLNEAYKFGNNIANAIGNFLNKAENWINGVIGDIVGWFGGHYEYDVKDENQYNNEIHSSRLKQGYYSNMILRDNLGLDRYGITTRTKERVRKYNVENNVDNYNTTGNLRYNDKALKYAHRVENLYLPDNTTDQKFTANRNSSSYGTSTITEDDLTKAASYIQQYYDGLLESQLETEEKEYKGVEITKYNFKPAYLALSKKHQEELEKKYPNFTENVAVRALKLENAGYSVAWLPGSFRTQTDVFAQGFTSYTATRYEDGDNGTTNTKYVSQVNKGQITSYPYNINIDDNLNTTTAAGLVNKVSSGSTYNKDIDTMKVKTTHEQYFQINMNENSKGQGATVWYCLAGDDFWTYNSSDASGRNYNGIRNDCENAYYLYTKDNCTYTGAGHTNTFSDFEAKLFINTLVASYLSGTDNAVVEFFTDKKAETKATYLVMSTSTDSNGNETADPEHSYFKISDPDFTADKQIRFNLNFYLSASVDPDTKAVTYGDEVTDITLYDTDDSSVKIQYNEEKGCYEAIVPYALYDFETSQTICNALAASSGKIRLYLVATDTSTDNVITTEIEIRKLKLMTLK